MVSEYTPLPKRRRRRLLKIPPGEGAGGEGGGLKGRRALSKSFVRNHYVKGNKEMMCQAKPKT